MKSLRNNYSAVRRPLQLYTLVLLALIVDIGGALGIKYTMVALSVAHVFFDTMRNGYSRAWFLEYGFTACVAGWALVSVILGTPLLSAVGSVSFLAFVPIVAVLRRCPTHAIDRSFTAVAALGAVVVIALFILIQMEPGIARPLNKLATDYKLGFLGMKPEYDVANVYFRWSLWLLPGFALCFGRHHILAVVFLTAIVCTLSTALIIGACMVVGISLFWARNRVQLLVAIMVSLPVAALFLHAMIDLSVQPVLSDFASRFSSGSASTSKKLGHIQSVLEAVSSSWTTLLFGMGPGSTFYSVGVDGTVSNIEVSHFNVLRQFGLVGAGVVFGYILYVVLGVLTASRDGWRWAVGLGAAFIVAGTNPLLMSPVFFVPLLSARARALNARRQRGYA